MAFSFGLPLNLKKIMPKKNLSQTDLLYIQERVTTAPCVPALREAVFAWRKKHYKGTTQTTRDLLKFWFNPDH